MRYVEKRIVELGFGGKPPTMGEVVAIVEYGNHLYVDVDKDVLNAVRGFGFEFDGGTSDLGKDIAAYKMELPMGDVGRVCLSVEKMMLKVSIQRGEVSKDEWGTRTEYKVMQTFSVDPDDLKFLGVADWTEDEDEDRY